MQNQPPDVRREEAGGRSRRQERLLFSGLLLPSLVAASCLLPSADSRPSLAQTPTVLKVGVTLHPYYSWTANVASGTAVEVRPVLPGDVDAGNYQPSPDDVRKLADLDALVVNGLGHDDFITDMVRASGNTKLVLIRPNDGTPQIRSVRGGRVNSPTFLSVTNAIQQTYAIQKALADLRPDLAETFRANAAAYARRLRAMKAKYAGDLAGAKVARVVTVHDGYSYLMQEFGFEIAGVVEPAHGLVPSAAELQEMIALIRREKIGVVFSEETFPEALLRTLREATGARVRVIRHVATGDYTADKFEREMEENLGTLVRALVQEGEDGAK